VISARDRVAAALVATEPAVSETMVTEHDVLQALPQLTAAELIPEITSLRLDPMGRLQHVVPRQPLVVSYAVMGRRITGRLVFGGSTRFEIGCRLARLPYTLEAPQQRRALLRAIDRIQKAGVGRLGLTPRQELHLADVVELGSEPVGSADLLYALVVVGLALRPVFGWLDAIALERP
jgi:hypothetical protein